MKKRIQRRWGAGGTHLDRTAGKTPPDNRWAEKEGWEVYEWAPGGRTGTGEGLEAGAALGVEDTGVHVADTHEGWVREAGSTSYQTLNVSSAAQQLCDCKLVNHSEPPLSCL